ncbi:MAG: hypothetical protein LBI03_08650 [Clostridiales bacterium]|nr:hypothetical protein [Clostridiales bacterium]
MKKVFIIWVIMFLTLCPFISTLDFTPGLWVDDLRDTNSSGWTRFPNGLWVSVLPTYNGYALNTMKVMYTQRGNVLYGYNTENKQYDIPEGRVKEEKSTYIVIQWYDHRYEMKYESVRRTINLYNASYDGGSYIRTFNGYGDE